MNQPHPLSAQGRLKSALAVLPHQPQRQDALADQLRDLVMVANRLGMYDAADLVLRLSSRGA